MEVYHENSTRKANTPNMKPLAVRPVLLLALILLSFSFSFARLMADPNGKKEESYNNGCGPYVRTCTGYPPPPCTSPICV
ncbi:hypothetical protein K1719_001258 [Acacia pycnantha]|nr:hypothetical protein K1719_001258 [Acacia pycnantha]